MEKKVTWNDLNSATSAELKKTYKLSDRQLENQIQRHLHGANPTEMREKYKEVYSKRK